MSDPYAYATHALRARLDAEEARAEAIEEYERAQLRATRHEARPEHPGSLHCECLLALEDHSETLNRELEAVPVEVAVLRVPSTGPDPWGMAA